MNAPEFPSLVRLRRAAGLVSRARGVKAIAVSDPFQDGSLLLGDNLPPG